jgi:hypothetical protein
MTTIDSFPVLYTEFQNLTTLFTEPGVGLRRKIVFHFNFDGNIAKGQPTLSGFSTKNTGNFTSTVPLLTLERTTPFIKMAYPLYIGNIELTQDEYKTLSKDPTKKTYLVFTPVKSTKYTNVVTYTTAWSSTTSFTLDKLKPIKINAIGAELNPSPPKDPS